MSGNKVRDCMIKDPVTIPSTTLLPDAYWLMVRNKIRRLLIVDDGRLLGVITRQDVNSAVPQSVMAIDPVKINDLFCNMQVRQVMRTDLVTISPECSVVEAARKMLEYDIGALPVLDEGVLVGLINDRCVFQYIVTKEPVL